MEEKYAGRAGLERLLREISDKKLSAEDAVKRFHEIFAGEYIKTRESINQAYYQLDEENYYLTDGSCISFSVTSGPMDKNAGIASHHGTDISIMSPFSNDENSRMIPLFSEGENVFDPDAVSLDTLYDIDILPENILQLSGIDEAVLSVLPNDVRGTDVTAQKRYELLKDKALSEYQDALAYERISPFGGEDVIVIPAYDLLKVYIDDYRDDQYFYNQAMMHLACDKDFEHELKAEYRDLKDTLYVIDHIEEYRKLKILEDRHADAEEKCENLLAEKMSIRKEIADLNIQKVKLEGKRYGLFARLRGDRAGDRKLLDDIKEKVSRLNDDLQKVNEKYEAAKMHNEISALAAEELRSRLKVICYERNPDRLLKKRDYCIDRISEIDSFRKGREEVSEKLSLDERIKAAELKAEKDDRPDKGRDFDR